MLGLVILRAIASACPVDDYNVTIVDEAKPIVGARAYYNCSELTSVNIEEGHTEIATEAFAYCSKLTHAHLPNTITTIGYCAFYQCR